MVTNYKQVYVITRACMLYTGDSTGGVLPSDIMQYTLLKLHAGT